MRTQVMRSSRILLLIAVCFAATGGWKSAVAQEIRQTYLRSLWDYLPPVLETEQNLSLYMAHEGNGGPGQDSYSRFGATQFMSLPDGIFSVNAEGFVTNTGHGGASLLLHTRQLIGGALIGAGTSFTVQESALDNVFEQGGVHVEIFPNDIWSFRANGYVPTGAVRREFFNSGPIPQDPIFEGNNIIVPTLTTTLKEAGLQGIDLEAARKIGNLAAEFFGGYYKYQARAGRDAEGGKVGVRAYISRRLQAHFTVSNDKRFGSQAFGGIVWNVGGASGMAPTSMHDKLYIPVERNHQIVMTQERGQEAGKVIAEDGGVPITVTHVQEGAAGTNSGTFENPFNLNTLPPTQPTNIVYVHAGTGPYINDYTLFPGQRFLGEGNGETHFVDTQFGKIELPDGTGFGASPTIMGTLTASNNSEISNVNLDPAGPGIVLPGLVGTVNVNRTDITGGTIGIDINGGSGDFKFTDVNITDSTVAGIDITGGSSDVTFGSVLPMPMAGDFGPSSITQSAGGTALAINGGHSGSFLQNESSTIAATSGDGLQFDDADGTYTFGGDVTLNGGDAGIDILGGSDGTFTFTNTDITSPTGPALQIGAPGDPASGGAADVTFGTDSSISQATPGALTVHVLGNHSGTLTVNGPVTGLGGEGLRFGEAATAANGTYNFNGTTTLNGGDNGIDILGASTGTFTFANTSVTNSTGITLEIDGLGGTSEANVNWNGGNVVHTSAAAAVSVTDHDIGSVIINPRFTVTNGTGFQFSNADGIYQLTGPNALVGGDSGIDIVGGSDGTFTFGRTTILNNAGGIGVNIVGGTATTTLDTFNITTNGDTGLNIDSTGLTTVLASTDITTTNGRAVDINNTEVNITLRNVQSVDSPAEGIDIDSALPGSVFAITGSVRVDNPGATGISVADSEGAFSFTTLDIDDTAGPGVSLVNNFAASGTSFLFNGGAIDGTAGDAFNVLNTDGLTIQGIAFGTTTAITGDGIDYVSNDGRSRSLTFNNNRSTNTADIGARGISIDQTVGGTIHAVVTNNIMASSGQVFVTTDAAIEKSLILQLDANSWTAPFGLGAFASQVTGGALNSTIITSMNANGSTGRGMLFDSVTFDASGELLAGLQTQGFGTTRVASALGDGLSLLRPTGDLNLAQIDITNFIGTGLEIVNAAPPLALPVTNFNIQIGNSVGVPSGSIDTTFGPAIYVATSVPGELTGSLNIGAVEASGVSNTNGGPAAVSSGDTGDAVFISQFTATGGPAANALRLATLTVQSADRHAVRIEDSQGQYNLGIVDIDGTTMDSVSLSNNSNTATRVLLEGGLIADTGLGVDAINSVNTALTVENVTFGDVILDPMDMNTIIGLERIGGDAIDILHSDGINRTYTINNVTSIVEGDPGGMMDVPLTVGRGINIETGAVSTGIASVSIFNSNLATGDTTLRASTNGNTNANVLSLSLFNNTFETLSVAPGPRTIELVGDNINPTTNSLQITSLFDTTVTGNTFGGGVRVENATFQSAFGGETTIGDMGAVVGSGLELINTSGSLSFTELNITNDATMVPGVGLLVDTKGAGTVFTLSTTGGTIDSTGGLAMFLDPLTVNMTLDTVMSSNSMGGPNAASMGDGVYLENIVGNLTIADLQVMSAAGDGVHLVQGAGVGTFTLNLTMAAIGGTGGHGIFVEDTALNNTTRITVGGTDSMGLLTNSTIDGTALNGINISNVDGAGSFFRMDRTTFTSITGFTGDLTNSILSGGDNTHDTFSQGPGVGNFGTIEFNDGADFLQ